MRKLRLALIAVLVCMFTFASLWAEERGSPLADTQTEITQILTADTEQSVTYHPVITTINDVDFQPLYFPYAESLHLEPDGILYGKQINIKDRHPLFTVLQMIKYNQLE